MSGRVAERAREVLVAGCGAIGSVFACMLARAGHRVVILGRQSLARPVAREGIEVVGIWGRYRSAPIAAYSQAEAVRGHYDAVFVSCKSYDTGALARQLAGAGVSSDLLISTQNGLGNVEVIAEAYESCQVLAARVIFGAVFESEAKVCVTVEAEPVLLGSPQGGRDKRAQTWANLIDKAGINCRPSEQVVAALWGKIFYNAALNPLGAVHGLSYGELAADPAHRTRMDRAIAEGFEVASAEGVQMPWPTVQKYLELFYGSLVPSTADHRSSMLQDIERGKPTEIEAITGQICRRGAAAGIATPENDSLRAAIKEIEEARL